MIEDSSRKKKAETAETIHSSIPDTDKKNWQTPAFVEIDYLETRSGAGSPADGGGAYS
jgi:hypothetical protein